MKKIIITLFALLTMFVIQEAYATNITLSGIGYNFSKPLTGSVVCSDDGGSTWDSVPQVGSLLDCKINISEDFPETSGPSDINTPDFVSNISVSNIEVTPSTFKISDEPSETIASARNYINFSDLISSGLPFTTRLEYTGTTGTETPKLAVEPIEISYYLGGQKVVYKLSAHNTYNDTTNMEIGGENIHTIKIVGSIQGLGKQGTLGLSENFSDLSKMEQRAEIKKNAYELIRGLNSGETVDGIKYVEGNADISGEISAYETLIVKNGNVTISGDLNTTGNSFGIIVLNEDLSDSFKGNIYIKPNVVKINALMYADGSVISVNSSGAEFASGDSTRISSLNKQLIITGSLFTRNTIGGAILSTSGDYLLPGGETTSDFYEAMKYDLGFLREGIAGCDTDGNGTCQDSGEYEESVVIIYDSTAQTNPPKGFN